MYILNHHYKNKTLFKNFLKKNDIKNSNKLLIQILHSGKDLKTTLKIKKSLQKVFSKASIIGTSSSGVISNNEIIDNNIVISFSIFEASNTFSKGYKNTNLKKILDDLSSNIIKSNTKLLIAFTNVFAFDSSNFLKKLNKKFPNIVIAGGNTGNYYKQLNPNIFSKELFDCDLVITTIDSDVLEVKTDYLFNWETIGEEMIITKSDKATVYTIDNKKAIDVYKEYLGDEIATNLLKNAGQFPLIFKDSKVNIARGIIDYDKKIGSITFAGEIPKNTKVKFGFANIDSIKLYNKEKLLSQYRNRQEGVFIYSCAARREMIGTYFKKEMKILNSLAPTTGMVLFGEFFHNKDSCTNNLLNITTTFITLNEKILEKDISFKNIEIKASKKDIKLNALTNLIKKTSQKLDENNHYLKQFKNIVSESSIYSTANEVGKITYINKNFELISGYKKEELLGKNHNIVRHKGNSKEKYTELWNTIQSGKIWHGLIKNRKKDGTAYHVLSDIAPIYYKNGAFREYLGIRHDVTELEEYKQLLKYELDTTSKTLKDNLNYTKQYENAVNTSVAIIKINTNNIITYANEKFLNLSQYNENELIGIKFDRLIDSKHKINGDWEKIFTQLKNGKIISEILTKISKKGEIFITRSNFYPIIKKGKIIEYLNVLTDLTDIFKLNEEIINTQKEVVYTMGAIGETRSQETGLHVKRVAEYSYLLAILSGLDEEEANLLRQASPMHDIGKVGIPDNILNKPGKLTTEEFEIMKSHAQLGYEMLKHSKRNILKASAIVAREHHEKWNGSGYPRGLSGENIHIYGRITAIADVFDALGHDRIYKKAWPLEDIYKLLNEEKGKHFDPNLIDIFFNNLDKFLEIKELLND
jgi:PAS domain S-box-containing protein